MSVLQILTALGRLQTRGASVRALNGLGAAQLRDLGIDGGVEEVVDGLMARAATSQSGQGTLARTLSLPGSGLPGGFQRAGWA